MRVRAARCALREEDWEWRRPFQTTGTGAGDRHPDDERRDRERHGQVERAILFLGERDALQTHIFVVVRAASGGLASCAEPILMTGWNVAGGSPPSKHRCRCAPLTGMAMTASEISAIQTRTKEAG